MIAIVFVLVSSNHIATAVLSVSVSTDIANHANLTIVLAVTVTVITHH